MRYFWILLIILMIIYLNRSYAFFYNSFLNSKPPDFEKSIFIGSHPEKIEKIVILGDSLMAGVGSSSYQKSLPFLISKKISVNQNVNLINLAVPGATADDVIKNQLSQAIDEKPDLIIVLIGVNDIHNRISTLNFEKNYKEIIDSLKTKGIKTILINIPYIGSDKIVLFPWNLVLDLRTKQFNNLITQIASANNIKLVDLYSLTAAKFKSSSDLYSEDQFHPSDKGYAEWSNIINAN